MENVFKDRMKKMILEQYPSIEINNDIFLSEENFRDFSVETIALKLLRLNNDKAYDLYMNLYAYDRGELVKTIIKLIVEDNIDYFMYDNENKFKIEEMLEEYTKIYKQKVNDIKELKIIEDNFISQKEFNHYNDFDINFFNYYIIIQKLYSEKKIKYANVTLFISIISNYLKDNLIKNYGNYKAEYEKYINEIISHILVGRITPQLFYNCIYSDDAVKTLLIEAKFNNLISELKIIPINVLYTLNFKSINNIYSRFVNVKGLDRVKKNLSENDLILIISNMVSLLGYDNTDKIIRHLPSDENQVFRLFRTFKYINLLNVKTNDNNIIYNEDFIKFFMGDNLNEPTSLLNLIYKGETSLGDRLESIYAYWDILDTRYKNQTLETRLSFLENSFKNSKVLLNPDEYLLEGEIINSYLDNKKYLRGNNIDIIGDIRTLYAEMKHYYQKSIPYVNGTIGDYYYETLRANDPDLFKVGSDTNCCFKVDADADSFVRYCAKNVNGRVIVIKNKRGDIVSMAPIVRNGNLVLCNSIESTMVHNHYFMEKMFEILEEASRKIIDISGENEDENDRIKIFLVGSYKNDINSFNKYEKVERFMIKDECLYPLKKNIYVNMGGFDFHNYIMASIDDLNLHELRSFEPSVRYDDPRKEVIEVESEMVTPEIMKVVSSIYFEQTRQIFNPSSIEKIILNEDWFIFIDRKHNIVSCIVSTNPAAIDEYNEYLELEKEYCASFNDDSRYGFKR